MSARLLTYEQVVLPEYPDLAPVLVTVSVANEAGDQVIEESHVFVPTTGKYLQQVCYRSLKNAEFRRVAELGIQATRRLLIDYLSMHPVLPGLQALRLASPVMTPLAVHPFHRYRIENKFVQEMWEIQEWTRSEALRASLAEVLSYRSDPKEAELLAQVFTHCDLATPVISLNTRQSRWSLA